MKSSTFELGLTLIINKQLFQKEIVFRFLICPSLALLPGFRASKHDTREGMVSLLALISGNFLLSQNIARTFS